MAPPAIGLLPPHTPMQVIVGCLCAHLVKTRCYTVDVPSTGGLAGEPGLDL